MKNEKNLVTNEIGYVSIFIYGGWHMVHLESWLNSSKPFMTFAKKLEEKNNDL